jgi:N-acetylmuramoyl-L-alanine amidase
MILQHEMAHVRQGHTCDRLITQVLCALFWMNPFYRLIRKELAMVHEFLADEEALAGNTGATDYGKAFALMLLQVHQRPTTSNPGHHFFSSPVKRRLTMLQTTRMVRASVLRRLAVLPLLAGSLLAFSFSPRTAPTPAAKKIVLVIDAGHGGKDHGCRSGQYTEKDLNLKVAEHLLKLAPRYNVAAHLTRSTDEELSLQQRVERANKVQPDILLSLHVDDQPAKANGKGTFDVIVSSRNPRQELSRRLATELYRHASRPEWEQGAMPADRNPYVLSHSLAAAVVIEMGNIRNAAQMQRLNDEDALDDFCSHILEAAVAAHQ